MNVREDIKKKFYRDFTEDETFLIDDLQEAMGRCYIFVPPFVVSKMIARKMLPSNLEILDDEGNFIRDNMYILNDQPAYKAVIETVHCGVPYEFNNEGISNPISPYRVVWAGEYDGFTYFVKTSVPPVRGGVRVVDVWRKLGGIPLSPLVEQREIFAKGAEWDISDILSSILTDTKAGGHMDG